MNERVRALATEARTHEPEHLSFVCECGKSDCTATVQLSIREYEGVRKDPTHFVVVPGHEIPHVEDVLERHERYDVVRKHAHEAQIAIETDPRS